MHDELIGVCVQEVIGKTPHVSHYVYDARHHLWCEVTFKVCSHLLQHTNGSETVYPDKFSILKVISSIIVIIVVL